MLEVKYSFSSGVKRCKRKFIFFLFQLFSFFFTLSPSLTLAHTDTVQGDGTCSFFCSSLLHFSRLPRQTSLPMPKGERKKMNKKRSLNHVQGHWLIDRLNNARRSTGVAISIIIARPSDNLFLCFILIFLSPPPLCFPFPFARLAL